MSGAPRVSDSTHQFGGHKSAHNNLGTPTLMCGRKETGHNQSTHCSVSKSAPSSNSQADLTGLPRQAARPRSTAATPMLPTGIAKTPARPARAQEANPELMTYSGAHSKGWVGGTRAGYSEQLVMRTHFSLALSPPPAPSTLSCHLIPKKEHEPYPPISSLTCLGNQTTPKPLFTCSGGIPPSSRTHHVQRITLVVGEELVLEAFKASYCAHSQSQVSSLSWISLEYGLPIPSSSHTSPFLYYPMDNLNRRAQKS